MGKVTVEYYGVTHAIDGEIAPTIGGFVSGDSPDNMQDLMISILNMFYVCQEFFHGKPGCAIYNTYKSMASSMGVNEGSVTGAGILGNINHIRILMNKIAHNIRCHEVGDNPDAGAVVEEIIIQKPELYQTAVAEYGNVLEGNEFVLNLSSAVDDNVSIGTISSQSGGYGLIDHFTQQNINLLTLIDDFQKVYGYFNALLSNEEDLYGELYDEASMVLQALANNIENLYNAYLDSINILKSYIEALSQSNSEYLEMLSDFNDKLKTLDNLTPEDGLRASTDFTSDPKGTLDKDQSHQFFSGLEYGSAAGNNSSSTNQGAETQTSSSTTSGGTTSNSESNKETNSSQTSNNSNTSSTDEAKADSGHLTVAPGTEGWEALHGSSSTTTSGSSSTASTTTSGGSTTSTTASSKTDSGHLTVAPGTEGWEALHGSPSSGSSGSSANSTQVAKFNMDSSFQSKNYSGSEAKAYLCGGSNSMEYESGAVKEYIDDMMNQNRLSRYDYSVIDSISKGTVTKTHLDNIRDKLPTHLNYELLDRYAEQNEYINSYVNSIKTSNVNGKEVVNLNVVKDENGRIISVSANDSRYKNIAEKINNAIAERDSIKSQIPNYYPTHILAGVVDNNSVKLNEVITEQNNRLAAAEGTGIEMTYSEITQKVNQGVWGPQQVNKICLEDQGFARAIYSGEVKLPNDSSYDSVRSSIKRNLEKSRTTEEVLNPMNVAKGKINKYSDLPSLSSNEFSYYDQNRATYLNNPDFVKYSNYLGYDVDGTNSMCIKVYNSDYNYNLFALMKAYDASK